MQPHAITRPMSHNREPLSPVKTHTGLGRADWLVRAPVELPGGTMDIATRCWCRAPTERLWIATTERS
jgi:hypothetical protein